MIYTTIIMRFLLYQQENIDLFFLKREIENKIANKVI